LFSIISLRNKTSQKYEEWDKDTITTSDFTVQCKIPQKLYDDFCSLDDLQPKASTFETQETKLERRKTLIKQNSLERTTTVLDNIHTHFFSGSDKKTSRAFRFKQYFINEIEKQLSC
jgi:hypothetical protein